MQELICTHRIHVHVFRMPGKELMELQSKVEDVECLPTLTVNDIERRTEPDPFIIQHKGHTDRLLIQCCLHHFLFYESQQFIFTFSCECAFCSHE